MIAASAKAGRRLPHRRCYNYLRLNMRDGRSIVGDAFQEQNAAGICVGLSLVAIAVSDLAAAPEGPIIPLIPGPEVDNYKKAQARSLLKFKVSAQSRYVKIPKLSFTAHVLEAGYGHPVVFIHGGAATAVQFAPMLGALQNAFHMFAADRPGCGLTDKIDYRGVPFREHAVDFVTGILDALKLRKAALVGNSIGGILVACIRSCQTGTGCQTRAHWRSRGQFAPRTGRAQASTKGGFR
jgi:hypothetical protein